MIQYFAEYLTQFHSGFNVFQYITLRSILGVFTAFVLSLLLGPVLINRLDNLRVKQPIREEGPAAHQSKSGTPVMGGVLILITVVVSTLLWADISNEYVMAVLVITVFFGLIGGADDFIKLKYNNSKGLSIRQKLFWQTLAAFLVVYFIFKTAQLPAETHLIIPFVKDVSIDLGIWFVVLGMLTIVGSSNAVNLTDGLDGLAIMPTVMTVGGLSVFAYASGHSTFAEYLGIPYLPRCGELTVYCATIFGAGLGFLWFNTYPAQVFMGDIGALALGAAIGLLAVLVRQEIVLIIMGGLFVVEALSVIVQVASFRLTGKRVFAMAPIHHHFELRGWAEPKIVIRFWIIALILVLASIATLKIR